MNMKHLLLSLFAIALAETLCAQETAEKIMEKRAREMHRVISITSKEQWKTFIAENYSQALIDRPMQARVEVTENGSTVTSTTQEKPEVTDKIEAKARMFSQLNNDFGDSKITSIKVEGEKVKLIMQSSSGMKGTITLRFENTKPYLIDGLGIEVED